MSPFITAQIFQNRDDGSDSKSYLESCKSDLAFGKSLQFKMMSSFTGCVNQDVKDRATMCMKCLSVQLILFGSRVRGGLEWSDSRVK